MPRQTAQFEYRDEFLDFLPANGVPKAAGNYQTWMNRTSKRLGRSIGPDDLSCEVDVETLLTQLKKIDLEESERFIKNPLDEKNLRSTFRKYVQMVQSNFRRLFENVPAETAPVANDAQLDKLPERNRQEIHRIVRDTRVTREIKRLYEFRCQICEARLELASGKYYAEAHHLKPLGQKHNGPDIKENVICVCPNCHALLDYNSLRIKPGTLKLSRHSIRQEFISYHNHAVKNETI